MRRVVALIFSLLFAFPAFAEKHTEAWVMCQPNSEVVVRAYPNKHSEEVARVFPGDRVELYGDRKGRWWHVGVPCEAGEGWIRGDHLSFYEPEVFEGGKTFVTTRKMVIARFSIRGNVRRKLKKKGTKVTVYLMAEDWSATSQGYIMTKYLEEVDEGDEVHVLSGG